MLLWGHLKACCVWLLSNRLLRSLSVDKRITWAQQETHKAKYIEFMAASFSLWKTRFRTSNKMGWWALRALDCGAQFILLMARRKALRATRFSTFYKGRLGDRHLCVCVCMQQFLAKAIFEEGERQSCGQCVKCIEAAFINDDMLRTMDVNIGNRLFGIGILIYVWWRYIEALLLNFLFWLNWLTFYISLFSILSFNKLQRGFVRWTLWGKRKSLSLHKKTDIPKSKRASEMTGRSEWNCKCLWMQILRLDNASMNCVNKTPSQAPSPSDRAHKGKSKSSHLTFVHELAISNPRKDVAAHKRQGDGALLMIFSDLHP